MLTGSFYVSGNGCLAFFHQAVYDFIEQVVNELAEKKVTQRSLQAAQRREELLGAAKKLFAEHGYHATSTRSINQEIGMADGLMYHYFPGGKQEILDTIIQEDIRKKTELAKEAISSIQPCQTIDALLYTLGRSIIKHSAHDEQLMVIFMREGRMIIDLYREQIKGHLLHMFQDIKELFPPYIDNGVVRKLDPGMMAIQFLSMFNMYMMKIILFGPDSDYPLREEDMLRNIVEHTLQTWQH